MEPVRKRTAISILAFATPIFVLLIIFSSFPGRGRAAEPRAIPADLVIGQSASAEIITIGSLLSHTAQVFNLGPGAATNVQIINILPPGAALQGAISKNCVLDLTDPSVVRCNAAGLASGDTAGITYTVALNEAGASPIYAGVNADQNDPAPNNNTSVLYTYVTDKIGPVILDVSPRFGSSEITHTLTIQGLNLDMIPPGNVQLGYLPLTSTFSGDLIAQVPQGFPVGLHDLRVTDSGGESDILLNAFASLSSDPVNLFTIRPGAAFNDSPVAVHLIGEKFAPGTEAALIVPSARQSTVAAAGAAKIPLDTLRFIGPNQMRAVVPGGIPAGSYDIVITHTLGAVSSFPSVFESFDAAGALDLFASKMLSEPSSGLHAGETGVLGAKVHLVGACLTCTVAVDFYQDAASTQAGGTFLGRVSSVVQPGWRPFTVPWTVPAAGVYELFAVIDPDNDHPEIIEGNNNVTHTVSVFPASLDGPAPGLDSLEIGGGANFSNRLQISVGLAALPRTGQIPGADPAYVLFVEHIYDQYEGDWKPVANSGWLPWESVMDGFEWQMYPAMGVHYIQAWAADSSGNVSDTPIAQFINLAPKNPVPIAAGEGHIFRLPLFENTNVLGKLNVLAGDVDFYAWAPDDSLITSSTCLTCPLETLEFVTEADGIHQLEATGVKDSFYKPLVTSWTCLTCTLRSSAGQIEVSFLDLIGSPGPGRTAPYAAAEPGEDLALPSPPFGTVAVHLPFISRP